MLEIVRRRLLILSLSALPLALPAVASAVPRVEVGGDGRVLVSGGAGDMAGFDTLVTVPGDGQVRVQARGATSDLEAGTGCARDAGPPVSVTCASRGLFVLGTDFDDRVTVQGALTGEFEMADGGDAVEGGANPDKILGRNGADNLNGGGGSDLIYPGGGADVADGGPGDEDMISLGDGDPSAPVADGPDVLRDSGGDKDVVSYYFAAGPVLLRPDNGKADDGANGGAEGDAIEGGFERIIGSRLNDVMEASPGGIKLNGSAGDDILRGGPGVDKLEGNGGNDLLDSSGDGVRDTDLDCDAEQNLDGAKGTADRAIVDALDVTPSNCEKVEKKAATGKPVPEGTFVVPDLEPQRNKRGEYRFDTVDDLERRIERAGARVLLKRVPLAFTKVPKKYRKDVDDHDIVRLRPGPGKKLQAGLAGKAPQLEVRFYDEATELDRVKTCPYAKKKSKDFRKALVGAPMGEAVDALERAKCDWRVTQTRRSGDVPFEQVATAAIGRDLEGKTRFVWNVVVERPKDQVDFALTLAPRPQTEVKANPSLAAFLAAEPTLSTDGALPVTHGTQPATVCVIVDNTVTGRAVRNVEVELYDAEGYLKASQKTGSGGARTLSAAFEKPGTARVVARVTDRRGRIAEGFASFKVVNLDAGYFTVDGRYLELSGSAFAPAPPPPPPPSVAATEAMLEEIATELSRFGYPFNRAAEILASTSGTPADRLRAVDEQLGVAAVKTTINGLLDAAITRPAFDRDARAQIADAGGKLVEGRNPALGIPVGAGDVDGAALIGMDGASLIGNDAGSLIGNDAGSLIGMDGATIIRDGGASLIGMDGATLIGMDGATASLTSLGKTTLISNDGSTLLSPGAAVISTGGNGLTANKGVGMIGDAGSGFTPDNGVAFRNGMALIPVAALG